MWDQEYIYAKNFSDHLKSYIKPKVIVQSAYLYRWRLQDRSS